MPFETAKPAKSSIGIQYSTVMEDYEFRIFPPARLYSPPDGAQVFVRLKSAKETGLAKILPADSETSTIACGCSDDAAGIDANDDEAHSPTQGTSHPAAAAAVREATGSAMPRLPPGVTLEGRRRVQYADGGTAYVRPARFTPVRRPVQLCMRSIAHCSQCLRSLL